MSTRSEREKAQKLNEQHQTILSKMLREDHNKYCADCEAKGPRWASWNLGVFMCIRCAGIHRNLGVHISRVKSVNLDQWTQEQIQSMVDMGNLRAKQLYEAHLPDNFRRPQTDQAVEFFIRDKYERKKYYDPNGPKTAAKEREKEDKKKEKESEKVNRPSSSEKKKPDLQTDSRASPKRSCEPVIDLLGLGGATTSSAGSISDEDIFGPMVSNPLPSTNTQVTSSAASSAGGSVVGSVGGSVGGSVAAPQAEVDLFSEKSSVKTEEGTKKPLSKDSILSLYSTTTVSTQPAVPAAMYLGQPPIQQFPSQPSGQTNFQAFPVMGGAMPPTTIMGGVMAQGGGAIMAQNTSMMGGTAMPNGYMGMQQGMMGPQGGAMPAGGGSPQMYSAMQYQQGQWNMNQVSQQMAGMAVNGGMAAPPGFVQSGTPIGGWAEPPSGQTLSTQLWK